MSDPAGTFTGLLLGTAVGDALGLPAEGLGRARLERRWRGVWRHRLVFGRGMVSDDTEHAVMTAQALLRSPRDPHAFGRDLSRRMRWWFARLPAGIGLATARACLKLWSGVDPARSGVHSAGSGAAMRAAVIGLFHRDNAARRRDYVAVSSRMTHTDPRAEVAALAVAEAAVHAVEHPGAGDTWIGRLSGLSDDPGWAGIVRQWNEGWTKGWPVGQLAASLGAAEGVSGFAYQAVPVAIYAWARHPRDYRAALTGALGCGGDTDTVGAVVGALSGISAGEQGIPEEWVRGLRDWPLTVPFLRSMGTALGHGTESGRPVSPPELPWPAVCLRNTVFLGVVLAHGFGRLILR